MLDARDAQARADILPMVQRLLARGIRKATARLDELLFAAA